MLVQRYWDVWCVLALALIFPGKNVRERKREREKFSRAIKHYRTSRVRLIKSAASTTAAHREERNHYQEKKDLPLSFIPFVEKQMGHGRRKKEKWPRKKILRRLETRMEMRGMRNEGSWSKKMALPWQTITKHWF